MSDPAAGPPVEESLEQFHRAGWPVGDATFTGPARLTWVVSSRNGEHPIRAEGETSREAWWRAVEQARECGMFGRPVGF